VTERQLTSLLFAGGQRPARLCAGGLTVSGRG
jgi:hypothetical protein